MAEVATTYRYRRVERCGYRAHSLAARDAYRGQLEIEFPRLLTSEKFTVMVPAVGQRSGLCSLLVSRGCSGGQWRGQSRDRRQEYRTRTKESPRCAGHRRSATT